MNTIVASMVDMTSLILKEIYWPSMIRQWILLIHPVLEIEQVLLVQNLYFLITVPLVIFHLKGNRTVLRYNGKSNANKSSLIILANSLQSNQTYQFRVVMTSQQNSSVQSTGFLLVQVVDKQLQLIVIS